VIKISIRNAKLGGTDWSSEELKSTDLNDTFDATIDGYESFANKVTYVSTAYHASVTSTTPTDVLTLVTPVALKDNQTVLIEAYFPNVFQGGASGNTTVRIYDNTDAAVIETHNPVSDDDNDTFYSLVGTITISTKGNTKTVKLQHNGTGTQYNRIYGKPLLKATLVD